MPAKFNNCVSYPLFSRATSAVSLEWLKFLKTKEITVIVCITHGDVLYFEEEDRRKSGNVRKGKDEIIEEVRREIGSEIYVSSDGDIPYSRKYWQELNLAVEPKLAITRILANLNLAVRYGIAIRLYASRKFWRILIWRL